jgi:NADH-quinone oxidoreductase subunit L
MFVIATIGAFTAFMAATIALTQNDIKRVVAYSTVSQLGYMAFGLGTGVFASGIFHLMTHAFFKGLLFLGCGAVIHGMHEEQNIQNMGGLRKYMPITFWTFLIGALANAGLVPLAGFWSKDELIAGAWTSPVFPNWGKVIAIVGLAAAFLTALYMFRLVFLTFFGRERFNTHELHPHEAGPTMTVPLILLAIPAFLIGFVGFPPDDGRFHRFIEPVFESGQEAEAALSNQLASLNILQEGTATTEEETGQGDEAGEEHAVAGAEHEHEISDTTKWTFGIISSMVALAGIFVAYLTYIRGTISATAMGRRFSGLYQFLYEKWRFDELYDRTFIQPAKRLAMYSWRVIDVGIIDATVNGLAGVVNGTSARLRTVQTGLVANYALAIALGMVVIIGVYFAAFSDLVR